MKPAFPGVQICCLTPESAVKPRLEPGLPATPLLIYKSPLHPVSQTMTFSSNESSGGFLNVLWLISQHFIFSITYECTLKARVLHNTRLKRLGSNKHSSLFGTVISYDENEVLWIWPLGLYSQHFTFFVTYKCAQKQEPERLGCLACLAHSYITKEIKF